MRKSKTPSDYIAVKAMTKSEYDQCNLAVLYLAPDWVENMKSRINDIALVAKDSSFYSLVYWEAPDGYFVSPYRRRVQNLAIPKWKSKFGRSAAATKRLH